MGNSDICAAVTKEVKPISVPETTSAAPSTTMYIPHKAGNVYFDNCILSQAMSAGMPGINMAGHYFTSVMTSMNARKPRMPSKPLAISIHRGMAANARP